MRSSGLTVLTSLAIVELARNEQAFATRVHQRRYIATRERLTELARLAVVRLTLFARLIVYQPGDFGNESRSLPNIDVAFDLRRLHFGARDEISTRLGKRTSVGDVVDEVLIRRLFLETRFDDRAQLVAGLVVDRPLRPRVVDELAVV